MPLPEWLRVGRVNVGIASPFLEERQESIQGGRVMLTGTALTVLLGGVAVYLVGRSAQPPGSGPSNGTSARMTGRRVRQPNDRLVVRAFPAGLPMIETFSPPVVWADPCPSGFGRTPNLRAPDLVIGTGAGTSPEAGSIPDAGSGHLPLRRAA
jgi:hypothetical protein